MTQQKRSGIHPVAAGIIGAAAAATAVALSDEKNRKKVRDAFTKLRDSGEEFLTENLTEAKSRAKSALSEAGKAVSESKQKIKKSV